MVVPIIIRTLTRGAVYALLASGMTLLFGVANIVNLAHTAFFMVASFGVFYFTSTRISQVPFDGPGWPVLPSIILTVVAVTGLGLLVYRFLINRVRQHPQVVLLITIALAMVFQEIMDFTFEGHARRIREPFISGSIEILGESISYQRLLVVGVAIAVMIGLWLILSRTKLGVAIRATANDAEVANLMGISVSRTLLITMGIGTGLAALAGVLTAPLWVFHPHVWMGPLTMVLAIVVLGGLGSIKGSLIGAFIIALVENLVIFLLPDYGYLRMAFALLFMIVVLAVRPGGLFGTVFEEERL